MRTALYIRVSTREQLDGYSISAQKRQLTAYCESQGWDVVGYYVEEGESAKDTNRTELQRMIGHIKEDMIDCVLVYKLDRLTRSVADLYDLLKIFDNHKCKFKSATEVYDTTSAMGRMFITLVASFAQFERERLSERVSMGMEQLTHEGKWKGGYVGYGHDWKNEKFVIIEHEADVVRDMYKWYLEGLSDKKIALKLNDMGITTRLGAKWNERKIRTVLLNKKNIGTLQYGVRVNQDKTFDVENIYPPIIDKETFTKAQTVRIRRRTQHGKQATSNYYYSGILVCSKCGKTFKGISTRGFKRYTCRGKTMKECDMPTTSEKLIDNVFVKALTEFSMDPKDLIQDKPLVDQKKINSILREIDKVKTRRKKWQMAWANEMISDDDFKNRMQEEQEKEKHYEEKLSLHQIEDKTNVDEEVLYMMKEAISNWYVLTDGEKKQLLQIAVDKIIVNINKEAPKEKRVEIQEIIWN